MGATCTVARNTATDKHVRVSKNFIDGLDIETSEEVDESAQISIDDWKFALSKRFYPEAIVEQRKFIPSFRDLALYFARLGKTAYTDPQTAFQGQPAQSKRTCVSFLLRLNWAKQREMHEEQHKRGQNTAALKALRGAEETKEILSIGELEAMRVASELNVKKKRVEIDNFIVREDYRDIENRLQRVDAVLHDRINENYSDRRLLDFYRDSSADVPEADPRRPLAILQDAGAVFKDDALRTINSVTKFHSDVYRNRRDFLEAEITRLSRVIERRTAEIERLITDKERLLGILRSSGALETLVQLQQSFTGLNAEHEVLISKIEERKRFDRREDELAAKVSQIRTVLKSDLEDRKRSVDEIRQLFAEFTRILYGQPGLLSVDVGQNGYRFSFAIDREGSEGVDQMVVFCFDLAVASIWAKAKKGFGVWIHDSSLFADVDPRQYAAALKLAAQKSTEFGFQYICCLNIGSLPATHLKDFEFEPLIRLRLSDKGAEGRLLGKRLPPRDREAEASA
jgi:uncharacterized protein YydD (DUF2326 family)